jgi:pSer/pThr/pTyr-binding forkhead associated (FHA) protein
LEARAGAAHLPVAAGDDRGRTHWLLWESRSFRLATGENVIGRNPDSQVVLDVPGVSRRHACITIDGHRAWMRDLGSKNGTTVRGQLVADASELSDRDQVEIGPVMLTYRAVLPVRGTETFTLMRERPSARGRSALTAEPAPPSGSRRR